MPPNLLAHYPLPVGTHSGTANPLKQRGFLLRSGGHSSSYWCQQGQVPRLVFVVSLNNFELIGAEAARPAERPDALDYFFRGRAALDIGGGDKFEKAVDLLEHALALDPRSVVTQTRLALALLNRAQLKD